MKFTKMHGIGNDYVYIDCFKEKVDDPSKASVLISDRHFGVGSDGLVLIMPSKIADFRMRMFNPDGTEAEMCGNAVRCIGKYVYDNKMTEGKDVVTLETLAGIKRLELMAENGFVGSVRVDMGEPELIPSRIPVISDKEKFINEPVPVGGTIYRVTCVSMGNPHAVSYVDDTDAFPLEVVGPLMERHELFPRRVNAEFVKVIDDGHLKMRVWERSAGETLACGTGACAVHVASVLNCYAARKAQVSLRGGDLTIEWSESDNHVYMTGPAVKVFDGEIMLEI